MSWRRQLWRRDKEESREEREEKKENKQKEEEEVKDQITTFTNKFYQLLKSFCNYQQIFTHKFLTASKIYRQPLY